MRYISAKRYGHDRGFSCCFRQWRARSHCSQLHGYALAFKLTFSAAKLDERNWVIDFGGLSEIKEWLENMFDHTTLVARDDPEIEWFAAAHEKGLLRLTIMQDVGCEAVAKAVYNFTNDWLERMKHAPRVRLDKVEVWEHEGNSAAYGIDQHI